MKKKLYTIDIRQEESDSTPRHLAQWKNEPISSLSMIYKQIKKEFHWIKNIILIITEE